MLSLLLFFLISLSSIQSQAFKTCTSYLQSSNVEVLVFEGKNFKSQMNPLAIEWSLIASNSKNIEIEKYSRKLIELVLNQNSFALDHVLENLYTVVGVPKIEIRFKYKPDGDIHSGFLKYKQTVYPKKSDKTSFYENTFGSIEKAYFFNAINEGELLPWETTIYFVGSHETSGFWP